MSSDSFWSVEDSPQFKGKVCASCGRQCAAVVPTTHCRPLLGGFQLGCLQVKELDEAVDRLDKRCSKVIKGSHKYKDGLATISQQQLGFADTLEDFCGGTDEESLMLGELQFE